jgi:hypothetical protein
VSRHLKTPLAAISLGVTYNQLINLLRFNKIPQPERDSSGDYLWSEADLARARKAFAGRRHRESAGNA